jgi:hypothetical protein
MILFLNERAVSLSTRSYVSFLSKALNSSFIAFSYCLEY